MEGELGATALWCSCN